MLGNPTTCALLCACVLTALGACDDYPRDARGTLDRVEDGVLRAGVSHHPPWICVTVGRAGGMDVGGPEAALLKQWAGQLRARIEWIPDTESALVAGLRDDLVDIVAAGLAEDTAWASHVALSRPSASVDRRVLAVAQGESAFLLALDRFLYRDVQVDGGTACDADR